jgi:hypothetical protein
MNAKKRKTRIGYRIDKIANQILSFRPKAKILSAKGHDSAVRPLASHSGDAISMQPGTVYQVGTGELTT